MRTDALLSLKGLAVSFRDGRRRSIALRDVGFDLPYAKTVAIVGESGCGKSLTARSILRILDSNATIDSGQILFEGVNLAGPSEKDPILNSIRGGRIGLIYQEPLTALSSFYTVGNQIMEVVRRHQDVTKAQARERAIDLLHAVGMPNPAQRLDAYTFELSGGQRQRVMIAMALGPNPSLLIADEPTTALDVTTQAVILDLLQELQQSQGMSILFITHDLGVVSRMAEEVVVMYLGEVVEHGTKADVLTRPRHPYTRALMASLPGRNQRRQTTIPGTVPTLEERPAGCAFAPRCEFARPGLCDVERPALVRSDGVDVRCHAFGDSAPMFDLKMQPAPLDSVANGRSRPFGDRILGLQGVSKTFEKREGLFGQRAREIKAVQNVSLELRQGETLALVGESGCGKTTLGQTIVGLHRATHGRVMFEVDGRVRDITNLSVAEWRNVWQSMRMVFQDPFSSLNPRMTAFDIVAEPLLQCPGGPPPEPDLIEKVHGLFRLVGLDPEMSGRYPHAFSGGQRQRIGVARALAPDPKVIIADEPVSALDVSVQAQVLNLLRDLQSKLGLSYLFISHDLNVVASLAHRVAVMYAGRIVEVAETDGILDRPRHPYSEALLSAVLTPGRIHQDRRVRLRGGPPDPSSLPRGCVFAERCAYATDACTRILPEMHNVGGHWVACHHTEDLTLHGLRNENLPANPASYS
ncbi:MAG: ABC transporter ATP-binding protein [Albidovulum sp.]|nr:ABC transporter ATP-binding protein [Albidovulum sp.]MDE0534447.1 ABC transporter ATP-binding protein [Albidovulum sp.]